MKFDFDDIVLESAPIIKLDSPGQVTVDDEFGCLPIFNTSRVLPHKKSSREDLKISHEVRAIPNPDTKSSSGKQVRSFKSLNPTQLHDLFLDDTQEGEHFLVIDEVSAHLKKVFDLTAAVKKKYGTKVTLMVSGVINPKTYRIYSEMEVDLIRIGVGDLSTVNRSGLGYPMASLIKECYEISANLSTPAKIIADGGISLVQDMVKAIAIGADYVFINPTLAENLKLNYGAYDRFKYDSWEGYFKESLENCMFSCDCSNLQEFVGFAKWNQISKNSRGNSKK